MRLIPFDEQSALKIKADCDVKIHKRELHLSFRLTGPDLHQINLPARSLKIERLDHLWQSTCFECFLKCEGAEEYLEFNFSPSGDWNCYYFDNYRQGQNIIPLADRPSTTLITNDESLEFKVHVELPMPFLAGKYLVNLAMVIKEENEKLSYYALKHPADKPDFHHQESFIDL